MKTTFTTTSFLLLILLLSSSCESDAFFEVEDGHTKLFAFSEISPTEKIKVYVNTAVGINTDDDYLYPKQRDAQVILYQDGVELEDPGFRYIAKEQAFVSQGSFRPSIGVEYGLKVLLKEDGLNIDPIYAETTIPEADSIFSAQFSSLDGNSIDGSVIMEDLKNDYFLVRFILRNAEGMDSPLSIIDLNSDQGVEVIDNRQTLLISKKNLTEELSVDLYQDLFDSGTHVDVELNSITADAYDYYKAFNGQSNENSHLLFEPVIDRSNFQDGLGLFTGQSRFVGSYIVE